MLEASDAGKRKRIGDNEMTNLWNLKEIPFEKIEKVPGTTVTEVFWNAVNLRGSKPWLREKKFGIWNTWSWSQVGEVAAEIGNGLLSLGLARQEVVSVLSNTIIEWVLSDLGALSCGAVVSGIYPTDASGQVHYLCEDSRTTFLFVEDEEQLDKALDVRDRLPLLRKIIVFDMKGLRDLNDPMVISLEALRGLGRKFVVEHPNALDDRIKEIKSSDLAMLVYTSGTTGRPKGAMSSHAGLLAGIYNMDAAMPQTESDERMAFLPLCHIAEKLAGYYLAMYAGCKLNFVENPETVPENVREISPTVLFAVPRVWEKFYSGISMSVKESTKLQQALYKWAIGVGQKVAERFLKGETISATQKLKFIVARWLALDNVRKSIGIHNSRLLYTSAAPIAPDLIRWYFALGIPMYEAWGQTESGGPATMTRMGHVKLGTIGKALPGVEVNIDPQTGELLIRSKSLFLGYLNMPEKTEETLDKDGWLHSGDIGTMDSEGYFKITDRMKDIIITAGGKNITPSEIENELKFSPYITDAVVIGDKRPFITAIIMIELENVEKFAQDNDIPFSSYASLTRAKEVQLLIQSEIDAVNKKFARVEQVKKFFLLDTQLSAEDEELTPTMKLKRKLVNEKYKVQIDAMYNA